MKRRVFPNLVRLGRRVRSHVFRTPVGGEVHEEFDFHVEMRVRQHLREGMTREQAKKAAILRFGDIDRVKAICARIAGQREKRMRRRDWIGELRQDVAFAVRQIGRSPSFAVVVVVTLAIGVGANSAVFSVVNGVLLRPLPYDRPDDVVALWSRYLPESGHEVPKNPLSLIEILDYRDQSKSVASVAYYRTGTRTFGGDGIDPERVTVTSASAALFPLLGIRPALGRWYTSEESGPEARFLLLRDGYWRRRYGADPSVLGRSVTVDGVSGTIVGVMPAGFVFPDAATDAWVNSILNRTNSPARGAHFVSAVGRLAPGVTLEQAELELETINAAWALEYSHHDNGHILFVEPLRFHLVGDVQTLLWLLSAAVGLVLLIACANVANLLLARAETRQHEFTVRAALGAGRGRIVRQLLTENAVLSGLGAALGLGLALALGRGALGLDPTAIPRAENVGVDASVLAFTGSLGVAAALVFGLAPALRAGSSGPGGGLASGSKAGASPRRRRVRRILVGFEVALSVVLVISAGLLVRSFRALTGVESGVETAGVLTFRLSTPTARYSPAEAVTFYDELVRRLEGLPGVRAVGAVSNLPLTTPGFRNEFILEAGESPLDGERGWNAEVTVATPRYMTAMGVQQIAGRTFTADDRHGSSGVAVINQEFARLFLPGVDPIGRRVAYKPWEEPPPWATIVGVVRDTRTEALDVEVFPQVYLPHAQADTAVGGLFRTMTVSVPTDVAPETLVSAARATVAELDPNIPIFEVRTMEEVVRTSVARERLTTNLLGTFGLIALVLAAVGVYGVVSYSVSRRTREIGIRMALGADSGRVARMVVLEGAWPALAGVGAGMAAALALSGFLRGLLFQVSPTDPVTFATIPLLLMLVALLASYVPARRAVQITPTEALKEDY